MSSLPSAARPVLVEELAKVPAFFRRDLLILWSYRLAFFGDWLNLLIQVLVFYFVGHLIAPGALPSLPGAGKPTYIEFVSIGIALASFMQIGLSRVAMAIHQEQLQGTLEVLLLSPTAPTTVQLGSATYDLAYVPIRTAVFLTLVSVAFGVHFTLGGLFPSLVVLLAFIPVVWGLGMISAGAVLTFRRGASIVGFGATLLTIGSGTYFPTNVLPGWLQGAADYNPITISLEALRSLLLAHEGWTAVWPSLVLLIPMAVVTLSIGALSFRLALRREVRRGTLGLY